MGKKRVAKKTGEETAKEGVKPSVQTGLPAEMPSAGAAGGGRSGRVYIFSSYNNTMMSLADMQGNVLVNSSAGAIGFKGTKKSTPFAASKVAEIIAGAAKNKGIGKLEVYVKGIGSGRDAAIRAIGGKEFEIVSIKDITPIPHNGPKAPKVRRV